MASKIPATQSLSELGYRLLHKRIYKALWSTPEVEHFIYRSGSYAGPSAHFGIRNPCAEAFGVQSITTYGGDIFAKTLQHDERSSCAMSFSFVLFDPFWSRNIRRLDSPLFATAVRDLMTERLLPVIKDVTTADKLLSLLEHLAS